MRTQRRALFALLLSAALLTPVVPASADPIDGQWSCTYYKWDAEAKRWRRITWMSPSTSFEDDFVEGVDWHCKYNCIPMIVYREGGGPDPVGVPVAASDLARRAMRVAGEHGVVAPDLGALVTSSGVTDPWSGPACPPVPPEWDAEELDSLRT